MIRITTKSRMFLITLSLKNSQKLIIFFSCKLSFLKKAVNHLLYSMYTALERKHTKLPFFGPGSLFTTVTEFIPLIKIPLKL